MTINQKKEYYSSSGCSGGQIKIELAHTSQFTCLSTINNFINLNDQTLQNILGNTIINPQKIKDIEKLTQLQKIDLSSKNLDVLNNIEFSNLNSLTHIDFSNNQMNHMNNLLICTSLTYLNLDNNNITIIPSNISDLQNLEFLSVAHNRLSSVNSLNSLSNLQTLNLSNNSSLNSSIELPISLTSLNLSNTMISSTIGLNLLVNLEIFKMKETQITSIDDITNLSNLTTIDVSFNNITSVNLDSNPTNLNNLQTLNLSNNSSLTTLSIGYLNNLHTLNCEDCVSLPDFTLSNLPNLEIVKFNNCNIFQNGFHQIGLLLYSQYLNFKLRHIDLSNNQANLNTWYDNLNLSNLEVFSNIAKDIDVSTKGEFSSTTNAPTTNPSTVSESFTTTVDFTPVTITQPPDELKIPLNNFILTAELENTNNEIITCDVSFTQKNNNFEIFSVMRIRNSDVITNDVFEFRRFLPESLSSNDLEETDILTVTAPTFRVTSKKTNLRLYLYNNNLSLADTVTDNIWNEMQDKLILLRDFKIYNNRLTKPFNCKIINKFNDKFNNISNSNQYNLQGQLEDIGYQATAGYNARCINTTLLQTTSEFVHYEPEIKYRQTEPWVYNYNRLLNKNKDENFSFNYVTIINIVNILILFFIILKLNKIIK